MDLERITYPKELEFHDIPPQQLAKLEKSSTPEELAAVIESNIIRRQLKWVIPVAVNIHNMMVDQQKDAEMIRRLRWLAGVLVSLAAFVHMILSVVKAITPFQK